MLMLLSPAKSLDFDRPSPSIPLTTPAFESDAALLADRLRRCAPAEIGKLMSLSDSLADLNAERFARWETGVMTPPDARHAMLAFDGDVYEGLEAASLKRADLQWAQNHLCILSGLYGALRPLDALQPYRLEMGTRLATERGSDLYAFWGHRVTNAINEQLQMLAAKREPSVLLNLASNEYAKVLRLKPGPQTATDPGGPGLQAGLVISPVFEDEQPNGDYKVVSFYAKRARGLMARFVIEHRLVKPEDLTAFKAEGYRWMKGMSTQERPIFRRRRPT
ncbi:MAG: peroxide stress protein YaaA [Pseudomonadota bacterium]|jgi:cytoplasmic iron level regulating protein YaaA (DUF328/UPF0246 family)